MVGRSNRMEVGANVDAFVEATLDWSALEESDLPELAELREAVEYFDDPVTRVGLAELAVAFRAPGAAPALNAVVGRDRVGGNFVAYGWNLLDSSACPPRVVLSGAVHPGWRDQKIGHALAGWQVARAREWAAELPSAPATVWLGVYTDDNQSGAQRLFSNHGLTPERYFFDMHHVFARVPDPPPPPPVAGVTFAPYTASESMAVRDLHNVCFGGDVSVDTWTAMQQRPVFRPEWSWLAYAEGRLIGYALNSADEQAWVEQGFTEGWTDRLGVHPDYRRRGVARGLLSWSMWSFGRAGLEGAGLGVDTTDAVEALRLYEAIGYESQEMVVLLSATLPVGVT